MHTYGGVLRIGPGPPRRQPPTAVSATRRFPLWAVTLSMLVTVVGVLPGLMTGAMAVQLTADLDFGIAALGTAVAIVYGTSAIASIYLGQVTDRLGAPRALRLAAAFAAVGFFGIAATAQSWLTLVVWLVVAAIGSALGQPAANRMLINRVPAHRLGIAFGFKQSAAPAAGMLAGLSVPIVALTLGWRWAFLFAGIMAVLLLPGVRPVAPRVRATRTGGPSVVEKVRFRTVLLPALGFTFGNASSSTIAAFYVSAAVDAGSSPQFAGSLLAVSSAAAITTRLVIGFTADRRDGGHLAWCSALQAVGVLGVLLLIVGRPGTMAVGVVIALSGVWGYNGLFWYSIMRAYPHNPGQVTGLIAPGGFFGGTFGPMIFGLVAESAGYRWAWVLPLVLAATASAAMWAASRQVRAA